MSAESAVVPENATGITVRYWAAARAAAGTDADLVQTDRPTPLADLLAAARALHPQPRFAAVLGTCSLMVDDRPVGTRDVAQVLVEPGSSVEVLPPFAGG